MGVTVGVGGIGVGGSSVEVGAGGGWVGVEARAPHADRITKNNNTSDSLIIFILPSRV
jgi:hypothetical protein